MFNFFKNKQKAGKSIEETLPVFTELIVGLVNQSDSNALFNIKKDEFGISFRFAQFDLYVHFY